MRGNRPANDATHDAPVSSATVKSIQSPPARRYAPSNSLPAVSGATIAAMKVITANTIRWIAIGRAAPLVQANHRIEIVIRNHIWVRHAELWFSNQNRDIWLRRMPQCRQSSTAAPQQALLHRSSHENAWAPPRLQGLARRRGETQGTQTNHNAKDRIGANRLALHVFRLTAAPRHVPLAAIRKIYIDFSCIRKRSTAIFFCSALGGSRHFSAVPDVRSNVGFWRISGLVMLKLSCSPVGAAARGHRRRQHADNYIVESAFGGLLGSNRWGSKMFFCLKAHILCSV